MQEQIDLDNIQTHLKQHIVAIAATATTKREMLNDTNYFSLINMIDCQALTLRRRGGEMCEGKVCTDIISFSPFKD